MSNVRQNCKVVHTSMKLGQHGDSNSRYNGPMEKQITKNNVTMYNIACNTPLECCDINILYSGTCNVSQLKSKIQFPVISSQLGNQLRSQNQFALTQNNSTKKLRRDRRMRLPPKVNPKICSREYGSVSPSD